MGFSSWWHWVVVAIVVLVLFGGGGKIPRLMGDLAKGIRSFKTGLKPEDAAEAEEPEEVEPAPRVTAEAPKKRAASTRSKSTAKSGAAGRKTAKS